MPSKQRLNHSHYRNRGALEIQLVNQTLATRGTANTQGALRVQILSGRDMAHAASHVCIPALDRGVDIVTVQQLLGHSTVTVTMRYTHPNLDSKRAAVEKLEGFGDNLVTVCTKTQQSTPKLSRRAPLSAVASYT